MEDEYKLTDISNIDEQDPDSEEGGVLSFVLELVKITLISLAIIIPVRYFLIKPFYVNGASMEPNYHNHEYLIIDEISYRLNPPKRGEVVVFKYPENPKEFFIKRIIGLPGERVVITGGDVFIYNSKNLNGIKIQEPYLEKDLKTAGNIDTVLDEDEYFVLGDNRNSSLDSRRFGALKKNEIIGKTWIRVLPVDKMGILNNYTFDF